MEYVSQRGFMQAVEGKRKDPQTAWVTREVEDSIIERLRTHGLGIQKVAKENGLTIREVMDAVFERTARERKAAHDRGYQEGRLAAAFPLRPCPIPAARRAA